MARILWKGAISFGLLHAPVTLYPAVRKDDVDFDWLERKTLQPVGYKRVVKESGKEVDKDNVVKAIRQEDSSYVVLSDEEIKSANVKSSHTIDIVSFAEAQELPFLYFETPYFIAPIKGGEKVYALLREALLSTQKVGIALIVLHNKQHLAALIPTARAIVLNTLRWAVEVKDPDELDLPPAGAEEANIKPKELTMAAQLIESMVEPWNPAQYRDTFRDDIMALVNKKVAEGKAHVIDAVKVAEPKDDTVEESDLAALLKRSLQGATARRSDKTGGVAKPAAVVKKSTRGTATRSSKSVH
ncbi:MAG: Ku protein [Pseudomonadota bacterium]